MSILHAIRWIYRTRREVSEKTIVKCSIRSGFPGQEVSTIEDRGFEGLTEVFDSLPQVLREELMTPDHIVNIDDDGITDVTSQLRKETTF